jgi:hypothetical protein
VGHCLFEKHQWSCRQSELWALLCIDEEFTCSFSEFLPTALRDCCNAETDIQVGQNTFVTMNIFRHIATEWKGVPSQVFSDWLMFYEIGPKTGSLIFHAAFGKMMTLPVDSHIWHAFRRWGWTHVILYFDQQCHWFDKSNFS